METIELRARYGYVHLLKHIGGNLWQLEVDPKSVGTYRIIGFEGHSPFEAYCFALDPDGGPFMSVGDKINNKTIKSITSSGIFELE